MSLYKSDIGVFLHKLRMGRNETLHQVSKGADIDSPLLSKIERGERLPTHNQVNKLAVFFNIPESQLREMLIAEKIIKEHGVNEATYNAIKLVEERIVEYAKKDK